MPDLVIGALDTLGVDIVLEAPLSQEFGSIRGENRKGGGLGGGKWKRLDRSFENSSIKDRDKHGKRNLQSTLVVEERALKVLVDNSGVVVS
ncbi:hypothetical protein SLEP1_g35685 [Rubroshorea leprosula]|uniref:Uncharacterized protein n=1 Tax=Rubroshorea leprosula TaxID=152421 RepID=A0AAV5KPH2_9ROSI|nr:hypothetical protein SLEP1_g35685 [Rubroshorea leprosula]